MQETLRALRTLQEIDQQIFRVREELRRLPAERAQRQAQIEVQKAARGVVATSARELRFRIHEIEDMTTLQRQRMRKVENQASSTRTDMALLAAFQHEIRTLKRDISSSEEEGLTLVEQADAAEADLARIDGEIESAEAVFREFSANVERELVEARASLERLESERASRHGGDRIEPEALNLYERLLEAREGVALAELDGRICQMCYMEVTPNQYVRVVRGTEVVQCPSCDRILFLRD
jgi:predicted  nucleic acid-binding Zn-ribbon protein